jgi:hypothetical protein
MTPGSESAAAGRLVYLGPAATGDHGHTVGGDCWGVPLDGSRAPRALTRTALAMGCALGGSTLVWSEHIDPDGPLPAEGLLDDPYELRASPLEGGSDRLLHQGYLPTGYPVAGRGFVVWHSLGGRPVVHSLDSAAAARLPSRADGGHLASDGSHLVAYSAATGGGASIRVVRVTRGD